MPQFSYTVIDARGAEKTGLMEGSDTKQIAAKLRTQGLFPITIAPLAGPTSSLKAGKTAPGSAINLSPAPENLRRRAPSGFGRTVKPKELTALTRQLATLLRAGMPLLRGLEVLARQERNLKFRCVIESLAETIKSGGSLSDAMSQHPRAFDRLYINMIKAGEAGGVLDVVLERLARFQEKSLQLKGKIKSAMAYPLMVMAVAVTILVALLVFVVPKFKQIFADMLKGAPLPSLTQLVITLSDVVKHHYPIVLAALAVGGLALKFLSRTPRGAGLIDGAVIKLPLFGELFLKGIVARFSRTLSTLLSSGVPILPALLITRDTCANSRVAVALGTVHDSVKEGASVAQPLERTKVFPAMVTSMLEVGEQTGQLAEMLGKVADIYEDEVDTAVAGLSSLIEPLLILFLALIVGTIVIALFMPIIRIVQMLT